MNYKRIYDSIIDKARLENRTKKSGVYYEAHHIIPKCLGGTGKAFEWRTHVNIVLLTAKEHFLCHRLLCLIYPKERKLVYAYWGLCNQKSTGQLNRYKPSSRAYEEAKKLCQNAHSLAQTGCNNSNYGRSGELNTKSKKVLQISVQTGEIVGTYSNAVEAARLTGLKQSNINNCCLNKKHYKTAGGFVWQYKNN